MPEFDFSQVDRLAADLGRGDAAMIEQTRKILEVAAIKIKKDMAKEISGHRHFKAVAPTISYDITALSAEIGPVIGEKKAGSLAWIAANGTATTPPSWEYTAALHREAPIVEALLTDLAARTAL